MSLLIDSDFINQADLAAIDPEVGDVADAESIIVTGDRSVARKAWNECADTLLAELQAFGGDIIAWPGSITTYGAFGISRPRLRLNQIVVSAVYGDRDSTLYSWMVYRALAMFYRQAANRTIKDRYDIKRQRFEDEAGTVWKRLWANGIPMVAIPLAAPGAIHDYFAGYWSSANVTTVTGGSGMAANYNVVITWVDQTSGYVSPLAKNNAESGPSSTLAVTVPVNDLLQVSIAGLNPPSANSQQPSRGIAEGPYVTRNATGWNVYVGSPTDPNGLMYLQNAAPIPVGTMTYTLAAAPVLSGNLLQPGQVPDSCYAMQKVLQRG